MIRRLLPAALLAVVACSGEPLPPPAPPRAPTAAEPAPAPPSVRLPATAAPVRYAATLTLVPSASSFDGVVDIDLTFAEPTGLLWLGGTEITVSEAHLEIGGRSVAARVVPGGADFIGFAFAERVPAGPARLHVAYRGSISDKDDRGVFREEQDGHRYLFSQFENIEARRAFPCFDEPGYKVPWQLTLRVPASDVALGNTRVISEAREPSGMKLVRFAETRPLPSYLVAFAVGPFDLVDAGVAGKGRTPVRIAVPRGRADRARYAARLTPELLVRLEDYFGIPYPYDKLDVVAVPQLVSFSAMENAGLITFVEGSLLARPEDETSSFQRRFAVTIAHEMAHQWFGDLVTMAWWDDVWLNEAFATWMEGLIVQQHQPGWRWELSRSRATTWAMRGDSLVSARRVRQAIVTKDDIQNAFDEITYSKGAAVISMFEAFVGPEKFRRGVSAYLRAHAHRNATSKDFLAAIEAETDPRISAAFTTFLDQPGVPEVRGDLSCDRKSAPRLSLTQRRYLPAGSTGAPSRAWSTPVCVRYGAGTAEGRACAMLDGAEPRAIELGGLGRDRCPEWVLLNAGDAGYYHGAYSGPALAKLFQHGYARLTAVERAGVIRDLRAQLAGGEAPLADVLGRIPDRLKDGSTDGLEAALHLVGEVSEPMVPTALAPNFARYVQKTFGARARAMGWLPRAGEDDDTRLIRPHLLHFVAHRGADPALLAEAARLTARWLDDPAAIPIDLIDTVLGTAAAHGDGKLFDRMRDLVKTSRDERRVHHAVRALASFRDPALARASLDLFLDPALDARLVTTLLFRDDGAEDVTLAFLEQHFDAVVARLPGETRGDLPWIVGAVCDDQRRARAEVFFEGRVGALTGGRRTLAKVLERIALCSAQQRAHQASLSAFLGER